MSAATTTPHTNPFPGLRPFSEDETHLFFGRENQVDAMVDKLAETRFLAVVGTSGSGKSSLVNCGLRPALRQGLMARAGTVWRMAQFRPGNAPIGAMARALAQDGGLFREQTGAGLTLAEIIDTTLRMSKLGLIDICEQAALPEGVNLLVVVDQFEELFRYRQLGAAGGGGDQRISEEAAAFVNLLLEVKQPATCPICVVLTMRSDFLGNCTEFPGLAEAINAGQYLVPRMTRVERRAAIEGPVKVGGAEIAPVLLTRLVNDVGDNPDQLSILQHALNRTWARWRNEGSGNGPLDLTHYEAIGTMAHALDQHAEKAYAELGGARLQQICEKVFKALTDKATDPRGVRRPTALGTLCALADATAAEVTDVIAVFRKPSRSFLMPPAGDALKAETPIDISHESLMRVWQRLKAWAEEEAESMRTYRRLAETADLHAAGKASLWRDPDLQFALDWRDKNQPNETWASRYHPGFGAAMGFLTQSSVAREAERAERQQQRQRELLAEREKAEAQARKAQHMLWVAVVSSAAFVVLVAWLNKSYFIQGLYMLTQVRPLTAQAERALKPMDKFQECRKDCPEMIVVPAGQFMMGSPETEEGRYPNEGPLHKVTIASAFAVSKDDVTFADWNACVSVGGCAKVDAIFGQDTTMPVVNVDWKDAEQYAVWFSAMTGKPYRLLSEAEWEYAARAGVTTAYYWGQEIGKVSATTAYYWGQEIGKLNANCDGCGSRWDDLQTSPVGSFKPNAFGLNDMAGNVWQWVQDCYHSDYGGAPTDGTAWTGDCSKHVIRGGSWFNTLRNLRTAQRYGYTIASRDGNRGFRVARTLDSNRETRTSFH